MGGVTSFKAAVRSVTHFGFHRYRSWRCPLRSVAFFADSAEDLEQNAVLRSSASWAQNAARPTMAMSELAGASRYTAVCLRAHPGQTAGVATIDDVRALASGLPRSYEAIVRDRVKFRVAQYVDLAFSHDDTTMGFAFPK